MRVLRYVFMLAVIAAAVISTPRAQASAHVGYRAAKLATYPVRHSKKVAKGAAHGFAKVVKFVL